MLKYILSSLIIVVLIVHSYFIYSISMEDRISKDDIRDIINTELSTISHKNEIKDGVTKQKKLAESYLLAADYTSDERLLYGDKNARITIQEFGDIECPFCQKMHSNLKQVVDYSRATVNWQFFHFPLQMHNPTAATESRVVECVRESYGNKTAWIALDQFISHSKGNGKGIDNLTDFVRSFGISKVLVENCIASDAHKEKINDDYKVGLSFGITATPGMNIIDNKTQTNYVIKGYKTPEQIAEILKSILN